MTCKIHQEYLFLLKKVKMKPLNRIKALIPVLPNKDAQLAEKFFKERNFQGILELAESDLYKALKKGKDNNDLEEYEMKLKCLILELKTYISYIYDLNTFDTPDFFEENDYY